jgi:hypothetical protein
MQMRREVVLACIRKYHPSSIRALRHRLAQDGTLCTDEELQEIIHQLQLNGEIELPKNEKDETYWKYLKDRSKSWWVYAIVFASLMELVLVIYGKQGIDAPMSPSYLEPFRVIFGLALLAFMPGYATTVILFPQNEIKPMEIVLLSIFLSIGISIAFGVALGAGYHFTSDSATLSLVIYTVISTFVAAGRRYSKRHSAHGISSIPDDSR